MPEDNATVVWKEKQVKWVCERILESELKPSVDTLRDGCQTCIYNN